MVTIWVLTLLVLVLGLVENAVHHRRRRKIPPIRIHVNGTRGKSTTTRLIAGILRQAGYKTIAKTTGTAAVLIQADGTESPLARRKSPSIAEQIKIVKEAALRGADALVIECMALNPRNAVGCRKENITIHDWCNHQCSTGSSRRDGRKRSGGCIRFGPWHSQIGPPDCGRGAVL